MDAGALTATLWNQDFQPLFEAEKKKALTSLWVTLSYKTVNSLNFESLNFTFYFFNKSLYWLFKASFYIKGFSNVQV